MPPHGNDAQEAGLMRSMLFVPGDSPRKFEKANEGKADGIVLPKSQGGDDVRQVATWLEALEAAAGITVGATRIVCVATETAGSIFGLGTYKDSSPRLAGLMWGAEDLSASLGATEKASGGVFHSPYRLARDLCLMAAAAAGVAPIDTV